MVSIRQDDALAGGVASTAARAATRPNGQQQQRPRQHRPARRHSNRPLRSSFAVNSEKYRVSLPYCCCGVRRLITILILLVVMAAVELLVLIVLFGPRHSPFLLSRVAMDISLDNYSSWHDGDERTRQRIARFRQQLSEGKSPFDVSLQVQRVSRAQPYHPPFAPLVLSMSSPSSLSTNATQSLSLSMMNPVIRQRLQERYSTNVTLHDLQQRGVRMDDLTAASALPPWWQVVDNFYAWRRRKQRSEKRDDDDNSNDATLEEFDGRPIVLGLERCRAYRDHVPPQVRAVGPTGLFSSGTNLLARLMQRNCKPPTPRKFLVRFAAWQVPWGKHNPEGARLHHAAENREDWNQTATLPVVLIRHPYTWLQAMCKHSYSVRWARQTELCDKTIFLENTAKVRFGATKNRTGHTIRTEYQSVAHLYHDWYLPYLRSVEYPMLMTRLEDLVFRTEEVITAVCQCVGGTMTANFTHLYNSANWGPGHGDGRTDDVVTAFVKHGKPLEEYSAMLSESDRAVMEQVFRQDPELYSTFGYHLP